MALQNLLGDITLEATQQELLGTVVVLLAAMLEKCRASPVMIKLRSMLRQVPWPLVVAL